MFYKIIQSQNLSELGEYIQVETAKYSLPYKYNDKHSFNKIKYGKPIEYDLYLPDLQLFDGAFFTDLMHTSHLSSQFLILSTEAWHLIKDFNVINKQVFDLTAFKKFGESRLYKALYLFGRNEKFIDWSNSTFTEWKSIGHVEGQVVSMSDQVEYRTKRRLLEKKGLGIRLKTLAFNNSNQHPDLFKLGKPCLGYYVSEALYKAITTMKLTGFAFESIEEMNNRIKVPPPWNQEKS